MQTRCPAHRCRLSIGVVGLCLLSIGVSGCLRPERWRAAQHPDTADVTAALEAISYDDLDRGLMPDEIPEVPIRTRLRPCCAFGADLSAKVGRVPVPGYRIGNILDPEDVGPHSYDSGILRLRRAEQETVLLNNENNGLVYTCRGGFIDIAHVRDYADWGIFLGTALAASVEEGLRVDLPPEGGSRTVVFEPVPTDMLRRFGRVRIASALAEWMTFQVSIWHEIATWYGWASVPGFSEKASAFSPEDLYSNLLGIKLAKAISHRRSAKSENLYNSSVTQWLDEAIAYLGGMPEDLGREATRAVDGVWWDSGTRLPDPRLVLRRSFEFQGPVMPWLVPDSLATATLREGLAEHCATATPLPLPLVYEAEGYSLADFARLEIEVDDKLAAQDPFPILGRKVTQADFPAIIEEIRRQNRVEFGPDADRPE